MHFLTRSMGNNMIAKLNILAVTFICNVSVLGTISTIFDKQLISDIKDILIYLVCAVASRVLARVCERTMNKIKNRNKHVE